MSQPPIRLTLNLCGQRVVSYDSYGCDVALYAAKVSQIFESTKLFAKNLRGMFPFPHIYCDLTHGGWHEILAYDRAYSFRQFLVSVTRLVAIGEHLVIDKFDSLIFKRGIEQYRAI